MSNSILEMVMPDGEKIFYLNQEEVEFLYHQMPNYISHGIRLEKGNTIFDVGANIGMFSLMCCSCCNNQIDIYAFEPIPQVFKVLQLNMQRFNLDSNRIKLYNYGLSNRAKNAVSFNYYPKASGFSTMFPDDFKTLRNSISSIMLQNPDELPLSIKNKIYKLPEFLRSWFLNLKLRNALKSKTIDCQVRTISQVIQEQSIRQIDLLKIDVEKSELNVLLGIEDRDWSKIEQIVIEVHDLENRVDKIEALLSSHKFYKVIVEQEPLLKNSEYFNIYAMRS